jgi:16S rRNA (cytidine1402-2'-O)-methyltransferase
MGTLYVVATPIGNLGDVTSRAIEIMRIVDFIAAEDTRQTIKLLKFLNIKKPMISYHKFNEQKRSESILEKIEKGQNVALVSDAGTPCISDPGYILVKEAKERGITVIGIPGACALTNALAISGIAASSFIFMGFLSTNNSKLKEQINKIHKSDINTFIFYESPKRIVKLINRLQTEFPDSIVSICSDMTKKFERSFLGSIDKVYNQIKDDENIEKGEYTIVFQKKEENITINDEISLESKIVDMMIKRKCTIKEAVKFINNKEQNISKTEIYNAGLNLKKLFDKK